MVPVVFALPQKDIFEGLIVDVPKIDFNVSSTGAPHFPPTPVHMVLSLFYVLDYIVLI